MLSDRRDAMPPPPPAGDCAKCESAERERARERAEYERAVQTVQRVVRLHQARRMWTAVVERAKSKFLDEQAIEAGARNGKFYSNAALIVREGLRSEAAISEALTEAWRCMCTAAHNTPHGEPGYPRGTTWLGLPMADRRRKRGSLGPAAYRTMLRKMYLVVKNMNGDVQIDPHDCLESIGADWARDAGASGSSVVDEEAFHFSWFECCDVHVASVHSNDYVEWLRRCTRRVTRYTGKAVDTIEGGSLDLSKVEWRTEKELLDALCRSIGIRESHLHRFGPMMSHADIRKRLFADMRTRWEAAFCCPEAKSSLHLTWGAQPRRLRSNTEAVWHARPTVSSILDNPPRAGARPRHRSAPTFVARPPSGPYKASAMDGAIAASSPAVHHEQHRVPPSLKVKEPQWHVIMSTQGRVVGARKQPCERRRKQTPLSPSSLMAGSRASYDECDGGAHCSATAQSLYQQRPLRRLRREAPLQGQDVLRSQARSRSFPALATAVERNSWW